jgi:hypothetical protein
LGVEPPEGEAVELLVREGERPLATYQLRGHEQLRLDPALREGQTGVLRLSAARWSDDSATKGNPCPFRLVNAGWDGPGRAMGAPLGVETNGPAPAGPEAQSPPGAGEQSPPPLDAAALPGPTTEPLGPEFLHTNACGDFTLLAREHWFSLRGYPEFDLFSMNIDSVFCYSAHHGGAPEEFLPDPMRVYHIEHATGSGFTPEGQARLFERIAAKGIPWIDYRQVMDWAVEMRRLNTPLIFNLDDWGFANADLVERRPARTGAASSKHTTRGV